MCGRSRCSLSRQQVITAACVPDDRWKDKENYTPSHNVAPGHNTPVVKRDKQQELEVHTMKWGLVPSFTKTACTEKPDHFRMFNARSETVAEKSVFSRLLARQRCVVLFNGFYEWKKEGSRKQPFYVNMGEGNAMRMAGLFDVWSGGADDAPLYTYTIMTTDSFRRIQWLHDRMPVILTSDEQVAAWLDTKPLSDKVFNSICTPYNGEDLVWHPVSPSMSSMSYQSPDASQNVELKKGNIASFFKTASKRDAKPATQTADTESGKAALQQDTARRVTPVAIKAEPAVSQSAHLSTAEGSKTSAAEANVDSGQGSMPSYQEMQQMQSGQSEGQSNMHNDADVKVEDGVIDLAKDEGNLEATSNDVLNTDDAGGIVAKPEPEPGGTRGHVASPISSKRHAASEHPPEVSTPASKKGKAHKPEQGTIESFFGRKK
ncbi:MAG: hypothetical protein FRX49_12138 [Trebouxia sp. A1-2]|nr:MAG: hypothetical protein FRX49_12138 [Trebouxia sp. A1-2]